MLCSIMLQEVKRKTKARKKQKAEVVLDFDVASSKENDFDLDLNSATYKAVKGQAGTRTRNKL